MPLLFVYGKRRFCHDVAHFILLTVLVYSVALLTTIQNQNCLLVTRQNESHSLGD